MYSNRFVEVTFSDHDFEKLLGALRPGQTLSAAAFLTALEGEEEDVFQEAFDHLEAMGVTLDVSDLPESIADGSAAVRLRREQQLAKSGNLLEALEEGDPLRLYLEEVAGIPACGDLTALSAELARHNRDGSQMPRLWDRVLNLCLSRVVELAREYTGKGVLLLDLIQEGSLGLWQALPAYEGDDFGLFRDACVRTTLARTVILQARANGVGQKMRQAMEDYRSVDERLLTELGRNPTLEEIAEAMHMQPREAGVIGEMLASARNLDRVKAEPEPEEASGEDHLAVEDTAYFRMRQRISDLLSGLDASDAKLLTLRYGLEGGIPMTPEAVGKSLGLTPEEVVAREAAALGKLREQG